MKTLKFILLNLLLVTFFNCETKDLEDTLPQNLETNIPLGRLDWGMDLPDNRGFIRYYPSTFCNSFGFPIPCDPIKEVVLPCNFPNGGCLGQIVSGTPYAINDGNLSIKPGILLTLEVTFSERNIPNKDIVLEQLNNDDEIETDNKEELAEMIVNTFSFGEKSPLSEEVVEYFKSQSKTKDFTQMYILDRDYEIEYDENRPYGYIKAYVRAE